MAAEVETYCLCRCPICAEEFHEWIELYTPSVFVSDCWCPACKRCVPARVIPVDLYYRY